jgi:hypothetical protein
VLFFLLVFTRDLENTAALCYFILQDVVATESVSLHLSSMETSVSFANYILNIHLFAIPYQKKIQTQGRERDKKESSLL